jgi:YD repeat-containing protein
MKRAFRIVLSLIVVYCVSYDPAIAAASGNSCQATVVIGFTPGLIPKGYNCVGWGYFVFLSICTFPSTACAPATPNEPCPTCPHASNPISLATGDTFIEETDLRIPGLSNGLSLARTWNSQWPSSQMASQVGLFGPNWRSTYEERVFLGDDGYMRYARGNGSFWAFAVGGPGWAVVAPGNAGATLVQGTTSWMLTLKDGEQRLFNINSGSLTAIIDRNGNTTQLTYDALNRLVTVTDPAARHLTFTYASNTSFLVTGVSSDVGLALTYAYDGQNRLSQVTKPDQTTLTFQYDAGSNITAVLDSNGKVLESHTYDASHRGLTGSRAGGVEAVAISY